MSTVKMDNSPYIYEIEPTNMCPYRCYMCPRGRGKMSRPVGLMSWETFKNSLKCIPDTQKLVRLHHFGEAVLHPDITDFIKSTRDHGYIPVISLNPATLNGDMINMLVSSGVGIACFSLDSLDSERLYRIRGVRKSAAQCLELIDEFIRASRDSGHTILKVIQMVSLSLNRDEHARFLDLKQKYPESDVYVYISKNYGFGDLSLIRETDSEGLPKVLSEAYPCSAPLDEAVILWNGDVVLCCYDYNGCNVIGNINESPISEIWEGRRVKKLRQTFADRNTDTLSQCKDCYLAPHLFDKPIIRQNRGLLEEECVLGLLPRGDTANG